MLRTVPFAKIRADAKKPIRASDLAVGYDVFASVEFDRQDKRKKRKIKNYLPTVIPPGGAVLIGIGVAIAIEWLYNAEVRPRSGLANRLDVELSNSPGTVDPDFRGETGVLLRNRGKKPFTVEKNMRIAQLVFGKVEIPEFVDYGSIKNLPATRRGIGGFGSTGLYGGGIGTANFDAEVAKLDRYFMKIALETAGLSNCARGCEKNPNGSYKRDTEGNLIGQTRRYGCLITHGLRIVASGFNRQYPGSEFCADIGCQRDTLNIPSGQQIEICRAVHAEQMAIGSAAETGAPVKDATIYVNAEPCLFCARMIAGIRFEALVILKGGYGETHGLNVIRESGIKIREVSIP